MNIRSLGFWDIREWVLLWRLILWSLGCTNELLISAHGYDHHPYGTLSCWKHIHIKFLNRISYYVNCSWISKNCTWYFSKLEYLKCWPMSFDGSWPSMHDKQYMLEFRILQCVWYFSVTYNSPTMEFNATYNFGEESKLDAQRFKVSRSLIINMILFVNINNFLQWNFIYILVFSVAH